MPRSPDLRAAATVLAAVHSAAGGTTTRGVNVEQRLGDLGLTAAQVEAAIELLFRQRLLLVVDTPAHTVRLTQAGLDAVRGDLPPRRPKARH